MTNLIERLRETASKGVSVWGDLQMEAADTIEALSNRNRQLVVESSKYCAEVSRGMSDTIRLMAERDNLRAEISKLDVLLEECKMDWSGDVTQLKAEHKHEVDTLRQQLAEVQRDAVPTEVTEAAHVAIEAMLKEYNYPANPHNAARVGWRACRLHIADKKGEV